MNAEIGSLGIAVVGCTGGDVLFGEIPKELRKYFMVFKKFKYPHFSVFIHVPNKFSEYVQ